MSPSFDDCDALGLAELVRSGAASPEELLDEALHRTDERDPEINAVVIRLEERGRDQLGALPNGPFRGVPFLLKDLHVALAGAPLTNGSRSYLGNVPTHDSHITERYRRAGLVIFGRTASPELGLTTTTESALYGATRNPWNRELTAGGSSGGAAAAVAAGIVPAAHASDGGGSIRIPAACCGLFGLKPSRGLVSMAPEKGEGWGGLSTNHAITRSVRDSAALLDATAGVVPGDPYSAPRESGTFAQAIERKPRPLRIAVSTRPFTDIDVDDECVRAVEGTRRLCQELGHTVVDADPVCDIHALGRAARVIVATNVAANLAARGIERGKPVSESEVEPLTWGNVRAADQFSAQDYLTAIESIHSIGRQMGNFFERYDVLLTPTMPAPPQPIGALALDHANPTEYLINLKRTIGFTQIFNVSGGPAMSVPLHWSDDGVPVGVQFGCALGGDALLLNLGAQFERVQPWFSRRPLSATPSA